ncbi:hypothetical protein MMIC_P1990 [Mariprofundus micogutta]|uniref:EF-hand domain-containing protein n=1 Tax=Mariprofundus micogutta TaxID=1921010 RepID=A0A1L8CQ19_9PROT|nr:EF-hand domain-containing protein [Mariprofundus micogutta]GAV21011.1 hypothetical protein MMIC_P1990 [Mariprofundus micogutta]
MKKFVLIAAGLFVAVPEYAAAMPLPTYAPEEIADRQMATLDVDHSNTIDGAEFERAVMHQFGTIDTDGDGVLSGEEMFHFRYAKRPDVLKSSVKPKLIDNIMKKWDSNKDGHVSTDEKLKFRRAEFRFIDRDEDEVITRDEMIAHWQRKKIEMESSQKDSNSKD